MSPLYHPRSATADQRASGMVKEPPRAAEAVNSPPAMPYS
jgi:hypothetical protein